MTHPEKPSRLRQRLERQNVFANSIMAVATVVMAVLALGEFYRNHNLFKPTISLSDSALGKGNAAFHFKNIGQTFSPGCTVTIEVYGSDGGTWKTLKVERFALDYFDPGSEEAVQVEWTPGVTAFPQTLVLVGWNYLDSFLGWKFSCPPRFTFYVYSSEEQTWSLGSLLGRLHEEDRRKLQDRRRHIRQSL